MAKRRRIASAFLALACLVILICMAQRVASLHALQLPQAVSLSANTADNAEDTSPFTPCELSAKTLLAAPVLFDGALPAMAILLLVLALRCILPLIFPPAHPLRAPLLRIHLINCNFRE